MNAAGGTMAETIRRRSSTEKYTLYDLKAMHDDGELEIPTYQRDEVWTKPQKQLLIDSLLNGYDIPKLYFRELDGSPTRYEVVDGQQRLAAIVDFMNDEFSTGDWSEEVDGYAVKRLKFFELNTKLRRKLNHVSLDVVELVNWTEDDVKDLFIRLQNGTPLKAAEKRHAWKGNLVSIVTKLSKHRIFNLVGFSNKRSAHEDAVAQAVHLAFHGAITDLKLASIKATYDNNQDITEANPALADLKRTFNLIADAFKGGPSPKFRRYAFITLSALVAELLEKYDLSKHSDEFAAAYIDFERRRIENKELDEDLQDSTLAQYTEAARSDLVPALRYRHETLRNEIALKIPALAPKDPKRGFTEEQRWAIYVRDQGKCQMCGVEVKQEEFHADHKDAHARGGWTTVDNGQVLCIPCNLKKSDAMPSAGIGDTP
jgi:hypothetical protein